MKRISIVAPCFNERDNVLELYDRIKEAMSPRPEYQYELIYIDITREGEHDLKRDDHKIRNASGTLDILKAISKQCFILFDQRSEP